MADGETAMWGDRLIINNNTIYTYIYIGTFFYTIFSNYVYTLTRQLCLFSPLGIRHGRRIKKIKQVFTQTHGNMISDESNRFVFMHVLRLYFCN